MWIINVSPPGDVKCLHLKFKLSPHELISSIDLKMVPTRWDSFFYSLVSCCDGWNFCLALQSSYWILEAVSALHFLAVTAYLLYCALIISQEGCDPGNTKIWCIAESRYGLQSNSTGLRPSPRYCELGSIFSMTVRRKSIKFLATLTWLLTHTRQCFSTCNMHCTSMIIHTA